MYFFTGANLEHSNSFDETPLNAASYNGHLDVVETLIAAGKMGSYNFVAIISHELNSSYCLDISSQNKMGDGLNHQNFDFHRCKFGGQNH